MIVLNTYTQTAKSLLCEAYHLKKMHYPRYVWILPGWFEESWWKETKDSSINFDNRRACTLEEMKSMLINSLGVMEIPSDYPKDSESNSVSLVS